MAAETRKCGHTEHRFGCCECENIALQLEISTYRAQVLRLELENSWREWSVRMVRDEVLRGRSVSDLAILMFLAAVETAQDADPELLRLLKA